MNIFKLTFLLLPIFLVISIANGQNCNVFKMEGDLCKYEACIFIENADSHYQYSDSYVKIYDEAIEICPSYSYAYRSKSVAYLKSGDFLNWIKLMNKAVELDPIEHLANRAWCRFQFFKDYNGLLVDMSRLDSIYPYDPGYSVNGNYHMNVARALCYKAVGELELAISTLEGQLAKKDHLGGLYDYLHLGVMYLEAGDFEKALDAFLSQEAENDLAENQFYLGRCYRLIGDMEQSKLRFTRAKEQYQRGNTMDDPYAHQEDKIFMSDILKELERFNRKQKKK